MARSGSRRQGDRQVQRNLNNLRGRSVSDLNFDEYEDYEEYERFIPHVSGRFQHNTDDD